MDWEPIIKQMLTLILSILIPIGAVYLRRFLVLRIGEAEFRQAQEWAWNAVRAAEQTIIQNPAKFEFAYDLVAGLAKRKGINLPFAEINALVEAAVLDMKNGNTIKPGG